jgi:hypothetical protein
VALISPRLVELTLAILDNRFAVGKLVERKLPMQRTPNPSARDWFTTI